MYKYVIGPNISNIFNIWPLLPYLDWRTCGDPSKFIFTPALFLIISKACCAALALAVFLLFPVPLHLNKLPTFTSQVNNLMLDSPSSSSTGWKKTDSPTWAAISNNKLTEFLYRFWGYDKISFISRSLLSAIFFCRIVNQLGGAKKKLIVRYITMAFTEKGMRFPKCISCSTKVTFAITFASGRRNESCFGNLRLVRQDGASRDQVSWSN